MEMSQLYNLFLKHPGVTTDSRFCLRDSFFFALKGEKFDGNKFAAKALEDGCLYAVVDEAGAVVPNDNRYILVHDVLDTMQQLGREHRCHFHFPVLQVTGTNGKTTTKELITAVLSRHYNTLATTANYNNHIGVPKTLLRLRRGHRMAVIETGANHPGEIRDLTRIVDPDYGLITNVGKAHLEGFGSFEGVIRTKGELFDYLRAKAHSAVFINGDDPTLLKMAHGLSSIKYGEPGHADYLVEGEVTGGTPFMNMRWRQSGTNVWNNVETHMIGSYNLYNALAAICVGVYFDVSDENISTAIESYVPHNDRSELRSTSSNKLIVDTYNANPTSMAAALNNFKEMPGMHKMVILGDMNELGSSSAEEHAKTVDFLRKACFEDVWLVGENFRKTNSGFRMFHDVEEVKDYLKEHKPCGRFILIKGSNSTRLFELPDLL